MFYDERSSLNLDLIIQAYEEDRKKYWSNDPQTQMYLNLVDQLASALLHGSQDLVSPESIAAPHAFSWQQVRYLTEQVAVTERVLERLEIEVAWTFCSETREMAHRCLKLAKLVVSAQPNATVLAFLRRLTRCYIAGFFPECIILCRGVLENAMRETVQSPKGMKSKINQAKEEGRLSKDGASAAFLVWDRGNAAVHNDPETTEDALGTIRLTMTVLGELYSTGDNIVARPA